MRTYARIQDARVVELIKTDSNIATLFHPALQWVDASGIAGIAEGWRYNGVNFEGPEGMASHLAHSDAASESL